MRVSCSALSSSTLRLLPLWGPFLLPSLPSTLPFLPLGTAFSLIKIIILCWKQAQKVLFFSSGRPHLSTSSGDLLFLAFAGLLIYLGNLSTVFPSLSDGAPPTSHARRRKWVERIWCGSGKGDQSTLLWPYQAKKMDGGGRKPHHSAPKANNNEASALPR